MMSADPKAVDVLAAEDTARVRRLVAKARAVNRDLIATLRGDFKGMPDFLVWHRNIWMNRARAAKQEGLADATLAGCGAPS